MKAPEVAAVNAPLPRAIVPSQVTSAARTILGIRRCFSCHDLDLARVGRILVGLAPPDLGDRTN